MNSLFDMLKDPKAQEAIAQIVTQGIAFLLFFWILKRFAWKPILKLLDERRDKISGEFQRISELEEQFKKLREDYESRLREIDAEARRRIQEAIAEGRTMASEIAEQARHDARAITDKAKQNIELEVGKARAQLKEDIIRLTLAATEKVLHERLDDRKHRDLVRRFIDQLPVSDLSRRSE